MWGDNYYIDLVQNISKCPKVKQKQWQNITLAK